MENLDELFLTFCNFVKAYCNLVSTLEYSLIFDLVFIQILSSFSFCPILENSFSFLFSFYSQK